MLASRRDVAVLETIYSCGLRISELCGLQAADIEWNERLVRGARQGKEGAFDSDWGTALKAIRVYWDLLPQHPAGIAPVFLAMPANETPFSARLLQLRLKMHWRRRPGPQFDTAQIAA